MNILLTGGAGDLGQTLTPLLLARGDAPVLLDIRPPRHVPPGTTVILGSILDRSLLHASLATIDAIVQIAGWHGIHESNGEKNACDFFDLNVRGTFEVFQAAAIAGIDKIVQISTTSVRRPDTLYGRSKILAERIAADYAAHNGMHVITLRPRGFIPHWNHSVYEKYSDWARWFWNGAVHIDDVARAVLLSLELLREIPPGQHPVLPLDSAYEYTDDDLANWDADGPGSTFRRHYPAYEALARSFGLDPAAKPFRLDIAATTRLLGYQPLYSLANLLAELAEYGDAGPPPPF